MFEELEKMQQEEKVLSRQIRKIRDKIAATIRGHTLDKSPFQEGDKIKIRYYPMAMKSETNQMKTAVVFCDKVFGKIVEGSVLRSFTFLKSKKDGTASKVSFEYGCQFKQNETFQLIEKIK